MPIFSYNHSHFFSGRLYKCTILSSDNPVRNFIPCYSTTTVTDVNGKECPVGTIGLYDTIEGKFYTNQGTGTFEKGADVNNIQDDYIKGGLILRYDGIQNTRSGNNPNATVWEDLSGNDNDVSLGLSNSFDNNSCVFTKSTNSGFSIANPLTTQDNEFTIECLAKCNTTETSTSEIRNLFNWFWEMRSSMSGNNYIQCIRSYTGEYALSIYDGTNNIVKQISKIEPYTFYETQVSFSNNQIKVYVNGKLENEATSSTAVRNIIDNNKYIDIGCAKTWDNTIQLRLDGNIYFFRVYNRALSDEEIRHNYELDVDRFKIE